MYRSPAYPGAYQAQPNQPRNFGSDLRALLSGMSRIVQILFTGIPVISFVGTAFRFLWKFAGYLGCEASSAWPPVGDLATAESIWNKSTVTWSRVKLGVLVAISLIGLRIFLRKRQIEAEESWENPSETEEVEEPEIIPVPETLKSEEGRQPYAYPQIDQYQEDFWDHY